MAWWNSKKQQTKAANLDYKKIVNALTSYFSGQAAAMPQNDLTYINDGYFTNDHVYSIIRVLTRAASTIPIYLYKVTDKKQLRRYKNMQNSAEPDFKRLELLKSRALEEVTEHPILKLLERPNPLQGQAEFIENALGFYYLLGNSYIMGIGPDTGDNAGLVQEMSVLPAQDMEIKLGTGYEMVDSYLLSTGQTKIEIPEHQICHLKSWSPDYSGAGTHLYGVSPIRAGRNKIKIGNDGTSTMLKMLQNMGMFGMFTLQDGSVDLDEAAARELEREFYKKQRQKGRTMFAGADFKWQSAGMSPVDLAILESNKMTLRDTCNLFSLPSQILNDPENKTYNSMKEARKAMWTNAVIPDFNSLINELNRWLVAPYNKKENETYVLDYDIKAIPEMQEDMEKLVTYVEKMYWADFNEKREMTGLDTTAGQLGEKFLLPTNLLVTDPNGAGQAASYTAEELEKMLKDHLENNEY